MKAKATMIVRILLGLIYFVFGLNGFLNFIPAPPGMPDAAMQFSGAMMATGYFFPMVKATEVLFGALLLSGRATGLALVVLAPVTIQIVLFHVFLAPADMYIQVAMLLMHLYLGYAYKDRFKSLFV